MILFGLYVLELQDKIGFHTAAWMFNILVHMASMQPAAVDTIMNIEYYIHMQNSTHCGGTVDTAWFSYAH